MPPLFWEVGGARVSAIRSSSSLFELNWALLEFFCFVFDVAGLPEYGGHDSAASIPYYYSILIHSFQPPGSVWILNILRKSDKPRKKMKSGVNIGGWWGGTWD